MTHDILDYGKLIDEAMHNVVRRALLIAQDNGLPEEHHFFITFRTDYPGAMLADELRVRYPQEMTIVLQHQFWDLEVETDRFSVVLSFDNVKQNLTIPFQSLVSFADPSVRFGLQFHHEVLDALPAPTSSISGARRELQKDPVFATAEGKEEVGGNNVVALADFRKGKK